MQRTGNGACNLGNFQRMRQPCSVMGAGRGEKHLCFSLESPKGVAVQDTVSITLKGSAIGTRLFFPHAVAASEAAAGIGVQDDVLLLFQLFSNGHWKIPPSWFGLHGNILYLYNYTQSACKTPLKILIDFLWLADSGKISVIGFSNLNLNGAVGQVDEVFL